MSRKHAGSRRHQPRGDRRGEPPAEALLDAEVRIGELTRKIPESPGRRVDRQPAPTAGQRFPTKTEVVSKLGLERHQVERFERMAKHPAIVEHAGGTP